MDEISGAASSAGTPRTPSRGLEPERAAADPEGGEVALKLVHTADWHLGAVFPSFEELGRQQLSRARLSVIDRVLGLAERHSAHAVLCAGDLFDDPDPGPEWWEGLAKKFQQRNWLERPVFLLPGNHDPLTTTGVYSKGHPFRAALPAWVHVVDRDDFRFELAGGAMLYAAPCRSRSESRDLARTLLPGREPGDRRIRIGMVHGTTFDLPGHQMNFPIGREVAEQKGLDYLAIGDTHGFRDVTPSGHAPTVYPSTPEPTNFGERDAGHAAVVLFPSDRRRRALVRAEPVAQWTWEEARCTSLEELRALAARDLSQHVLRLVLDLSVGIGELSELERILAELAGSVAAPGAVGVLQLDRSRVRLDTGDVESTLARAPAVIRSAAARLRQREREYGTESDEGELARRALYQLYQLAREA